MMDRLRLLSLLLWSFGAPASLSAQLHDFNERDRTRGRIMLHAVAHDLHEQFWDSTMKGTNFDSLVAVADTQIGGATTYGQMNGAIARVVMALNDSHTHFWPPSGVNRIELGWVPFAIGDSVYLHHVEPWLSAAPFDVRVGDRLVAVDGWQVERRRIQDLLYVRKYLQPRESMVLTLQRGEDPPRDVQVPVQAIRGRLYYDLSRLGGGSDFYQLIRERQNADSGWDSRFARPRPDVLYWRLASFLVSERHIRDGLRRAPQGGTLILDLRSNPGGYVSTLSWFLARGVPAERVGDTLDLVRGNHKVEAEVVERASDRERWHGRLIVLIDSESMSASESFADVVQRLQLGTILGDRSPGFLTEAIGRGHLTTEATSVFYGVSIAIAMLDRPDGSRVEGVGVTPDELIQPTPADLIARRDPVLARALQIAGLPYDPAKAMEYFRFGEEQTEDR